MVTGRRGTVEKVRSEKYNSTVIVKTIPIKEPLTPMVKHFIEVCIFIIFYYFLLFFSYFFLFRMNYHVI